MSSGRTDQFLTELTQYKKKLENFEPVEPLEYHVANLTPFERKYIPSACEKLGGIKCEKFGKGAEKIFKIVKVGECLSHAEINKINQKKRKQQAEMPSLKIPNQLAYNLIDLSQQFEAYREQEKAYSYYNNQGLMDGYAINYIPEYNFQDINYSATTTSNYNIEDTDISQNAFTDIRKKLPVYKMRKVILETIRNNQVTVISGNTGCGKSTQIPQYILEELLREGRPGTILVTQPRRISAITLADRVSQERCEYTGESVGYQIHLDSKKGPRTRLLYITVGILLRMLLDDENMAGSNGVKLRGITHVVVDEVHERNLLTDFSLIVLRDLLKSKRADLKLIVMSATLNAQLFSDYFSTKTVRTPILEIPGFTYPVQEFYLEDLLERTGYLIPEDQHSENRLIRQGQSIRYNFSRKPPATHINDPKFYDFWKTNYPNYSEDTARSISYLRTDNSIIQKMLEWELELIAVTLRYIFEDQIFTGKVPDDVAILVFLPGWDDISRLQYILSQDPLFMDPNRCIVLPLHSSVSPEAQKKVFERPMKGQTKIVLATNIAETSVTIDDVVFVIDCGKHKEKIYDPVTNLSNLEVTWISKANSRQRMGRAGRVRNGYCYKLYTRKRYQSMADYQMAEILRTPLEEVCLQVKVLNLGMASDFLSQAIEAPQELTIQQALQLLEVVGAIDKQENLTTLGRALALIPLNPRIGKMLIYGSLYHCLDPVLTIASGLSYRDPFLLTTQIDREKARRVKLDFSMNSRSDHIALLNAFNQWDQSENKMQFCQDHFLNSSTMETMKEMKEHLKRLILNLFGIMNYNDEMDDPLIATKIAKLNENSHNIELIKGIVLSGVYPNVAKIHLHIKNSNSQKKKANGEGKLKYLLAKSGQKVSIHPVSVCFGMKLEEFTERSIDANGNTVTHTKGADEGGYWLAFFDVMKNGGVKSSSMMRDTSVVDGLTVLLFGGGTHETEELDRSKIILKIDEGIQFMTDVITANAIVNARQSMMDVIRWKIVNKKERMKMFNQDQLDYIDQVNDKIIEQVINIIEKKNFNLYDNSVYYGNMMQMPETKPQEFMMLPNNNAYASTAGYAYPTVTPVYPVLGYGVPGYRNSIMEQGAIKNSPFDDESAYSITESNDSYSYYPTPMYNANSTFNSQNSLLKNNEVLDNWNNYDDASSLQESQDTAVYHSNSPIPSHHSNSSSTANLSKTNNNSQITLSSYNNSNENVNKLDESNNNNNNNNNTRNADSKESNNSDNKNDNSVSHQDKSSSKNENSSKSDVKPYLTYIAPPLQQKYQKYSNKNVNTLNNNNSNPSSPTIQSLKQQDMYEKNYSRQSSHSSVSSNPNANYSPLMNNNDDTLMTNQDSTSSSHCDESHQQSYAKRRQSSDLEKSYNSNNDSSSRTNQNSREDLYSNNSYGSNSNNFYPSKKKHSSFIFGQNKNQNQYGNSGYSSYGNPNENMRNNGSNAFSNQNFRNNRNRYSDSNLVEQYQNSSYYNNGNNGYGNNNYNNNGYGNNGYGNNNYNNNNYSNNNYGNNKKMLRYSYSYNSPNSYNNNNNGNNNMSMNMNNNNNNRNSGNYNSYRNSINMGSLNNSKYNYNNNNNSYDSYNTKQNRRSFNNQINNTNNNYYQYNGMNRNSNRYSQRYN